MTAPDADIAVLGGGLAGGLIALALTRQRPDLKVRLIERGATLGGNHVWSFFASDLDAAGTALVEPLITARWEGYTIRFPRYTRELGSSYRSVTSERFDAVLREVLPAGTIVTDTDVVAATPTSVTLGDQRVLHFGGVIDARGAGSLPHLTGGWQKFLGQMIRTTAPHGLTRPVVMDATVEQVDGYRFVYCLPFGPDTVFVEDTYYADEPELDAALLRERIAAYCARSGWTIAAVTGEETGVLPVVAGGDFARFTAETDAGVARAGIRAGLFQPLTSYSLPDAVRFALSVAGSGNLSGTGLLAASRAWGDAHWRKSAFYRMLTAMLFGAAAPAERYRVLQRFYGLDSRLIERFYAGGTTMKDKLRILSGIPPVPISAAVRAITGRVPFAPLDRGAPA